MYNFLRSNSRYINTPIQYPQLDKQLKIAIYTGNTTALRKLVRYNYGYIQNRLADLLPPKKYISWYQAIPVSYMLQDGGIVTNNNGSTYIGVNGNNYNALLQFYNNAYRDALNSSKKTVAKQIKEVIKILKPSFNFSTFGSASSR